MPTTHLSNPLAVLALAALAFACATAPEAKPEPAAAPVASAGTVLEPPDGIWRLDEQGREYFLLEQPRAEHQYVWIEEGKRVRLRFGDEYDVESFDDQRFLVKIYRVPADLAPPRPVEPDPAELERIAASYRPEAGTGDRLRFRAFDAGLPREGQWRNGFAVADFDGDGHADIAHGAQRKGERRPVIFRGDGHGNWQRWAEARFPPFPYDYGDVAAADLNGDGVQDLALAAHLRGMVALVGDGKGGFRLWNRGLPFAGAGGDAGAGGFSSRTVVAADWNSDGRPDLVTLGEGPSAAIVTPGGGRTGSYGMTIYLNQGDGSWTALTDTRAPVIFGDELAVADLDGDGRTDAALGTNVMGQQTILRFRDPDGGVRPSPLEGLRPLGLVEAVVAADFDGDGRQDLALGYRAAEQRVWRTGVDVFFGRPDGTFARRTLASEAGRDGVTALAAGDLDGDGRLDLAALTGEGATWVFLGAAGFLDREESPEIAAEGRCRGYDAEIVDLDGDRVGELVAAFAGEASALFDPDRCLHYGALRAWKADPASGKTKRNRAGS